jgi:hypothetical protein
VGKYRIEVVGKERQADIQKGFQPFRKDVAIFNDEKDAIVSADAVAKLYPEDQTVCVMEKRDGKQYTHHAVQGKAEEDKHDFPERKTPLEEKVEEKAPKPPKAKKGKKVFEEGDEDKN